jgi:hypothetical protein
MNDNRNIKHEYQLPLTNITYTSSKKFVAVPGFILYLQELFETKPVPSSNPTQFTSPAF